MKLQTDFRGDIAVITVEGEHLDASTHSAFVQQLKPITENYSKLVLNIAALEFMDSSGIGVILGTMRRARAAGGDVKLAEPTESINSIFELVRMNRLIEIFDNVDSAIDGF